MGDSQKNFGLFIIYITELFCITKKRAQFLEPA